jgi:hypothetical protein
VLPQTGYQGTSILVVLGTLSQKIWLPKHITICIYKMLQVDLTKQISKNELQQTTAVGTTLLNANGDFILILLPTYNESLNITRTF